ncbi:tail assembly protein [Salmonella phage GEC_vB_N3]|uniref:Tail assembly protein n=2 Tax=Epseptimavirus TaxID=2732017 RepID=A0A7S9SSV4_9CAUD|nr:tail assembly protein [Salmonella phage GEC_vB_N3]QPI15633.1 tail assembly protein [Salmonella phage GEC_vB_N7]
MMEVVATLIVILVWAVFIISYTAYVRLKTLEAQVKQQQFAIEKLVELQRCDSIRILQIERELDV